MHGVADDSPEAGWPQIEFGMDRVRLKTTGKNSIRIMARMILLWMVDPSVGFNGFECRLNIRVVTPWLERIRRHLEALDRGLLFKPQKNYRATARMVISAPAFNSSR